MYELSDIYANVERPPENSDSYSENDYENASNLEPKRAETGWTQAVARDVKKSAYRAAAACLGVLCLLLVVGLITQIYLFTKSRSECGMEIALLQTSNDNRSKEIDQLKTMYNNLEEEKDQLQSSYSNLVREKDRLQTRYNNLDREKDQLQTRYNNLDREKDQLQTRYNNLVRDKDRLQIRYNGRCLKN